MGNNLSPEEAEKMEEVIELILQDKEPVEEQSDKPELTYEIDT